MLIEGHHFSRRGRKEKENVASMSDYEIADRKDKPGLA
jgi:hypothetical protein